MQSVTTSSRAGIVKRFSEIVPTKEPFETASRCALPVFLMRKSKSLKTGRYSSIGFHRLLIEARAFAAALPKTVRANRREMSGFRSLRFHQPAERLQTCLEYVATRSPMTTQGHRMRNLCVVVGGDGEDSRRAGVPVGMAPVGARERFWPGFQRPLAPHDWSPPDAAESG